MADANRYRRHVLKDKRYIKEKVYNTLFIGTVDGIHKQYRMDDSNGEEYNLIKKYGVDILEKFANAPSYRRDRNTTTGNIYSFKKRFIIAFNKNVTSVKWIGYNARKWTYGVGVLYVDEKFFSNIYEGQTISNIPSGVNKYIILYSQYSVVGSDNAQIVSTSTSALSDSTYYAFIDGEYNSRICNGIVDQIFIDKKYNISRMICSSSLCILDIPENTKEFTVDTFRDLSIGGIKLPIGFTGFKSVYIFYNTTCPVVIYAGNSEQYCKVFMRSNLSSPTNNTSNSRIYFNNDISVLENTISIPNDIQTIYPGLFANFKQFESISIDESNLIKNIKDNAFYGCSNLTVPTYLTNNLDNIGSSAFHGVKEISSVYVNDGGNIGQGAFQGSGIKEISIGTLSSTTTSGYIFCDSKLQKIIFRSENQITFGSLCFYNYGSNPVPVSDVRYHGSLYNYMTKIGGSIGTSNGGGLLGPSNSHLYIGENEDEVTGNLVIPQEITKIRSMAFRNLKNVTGIIFNGNETEIGEYAFMSSGITGTLELPDSLSVIRTYAFTSCSRITKLIIGSNPITFYGERHFQRCSNLTNVTLKCTNVFVFPSLFNHVSAYADFHYYGNLQQYTENVDITNFGYMSNRVYINATDNYDGDSISGIHLVIPQGTTVIRGTRKFINKGLLSITIPNTISAIPNSTFSDAGRNCQFIDIPESIVSIGSNAFYLVGTDMQMFDLRLRWKDENILQYSSSWSFQNKKAYLHVPSGQIQNYRDKGYTDSLFPNIIDDL